LIGKISIIRWFQHFGKALPTLGFALFGCTIILSTLSIPFALRAHGVGSRDFGPEELTEIRADLAQIEFPAALNVNLDELATRETLAKGRNGLIGKCTVCHDLRTILAKARNPQSWFKVVLRMAEKPTLQTPITQEDLAPITAYLVAITPAITTSLISKHKDTKPAATDAGALSTADLEKAKGLYEEKCSECHELTNIDDHGRDSLAGWNAVVQTMIEEFDAELEDADAALIVSYLATTYGTGDQPAPAPAPEPEPEPATTPDADTSCYDDCIKKNQARSVGIEVIEADCKKACDGSQKPLE
jgi:mono/diheme cytochrome c family protein